MAGCSKKQYAILMQAGADGKKLASEMGGMEQEAFNKAFSDLMGSSGGYNQDDDEDYRDFDPDSDDDYGFDEEDDEEYNKEMAAAQNENADMRENEPGDWDSEEKAVSLDNKMKEAVINARKNGQSPQQIVDSVSYDLDLEPGTKEFEKLKTYAKNEYEPNEELDNKQELLTDNDMNQIKKYAERYEVPLDGLKQVIEEETQKLIDKGASVTNAKNDAMESVLDDVVSRGNLESFLRNEENKGNPYDPEKLPDEGMSQEEYEARIKPEAEKFKKQLENAGYKLKENEYGVEKNKETPNYRTPEDMVDGELKKQGWTDEQLKKLTKDDYDYLAAMYKRILGLDFHKEGPTDIHDLVNGEK